VKQAIFVYVNNVQICSLNQAVLSNEGNLVSCSREKREPLKSW